VPALSIHQEAITDATSEQATKFVVDHDGSPSEWVEHIATGYPTFYQSPLTRYFTA
jgi:hypothetical protein